jgi:phytanoyl-CoA hydroxylase
MSAPALEARPSEDRPGDYYQAAGYYIYRKLIPYDAIDHLLATYRRTVLASSAPFFRQSTNRWARNKLSPHGYAVDSYRDVHDYPDHPTFCDAVRAVLCADEVRKALPQLTGHADHKVMQSMLFDLNTATPAHQDWYYLDSMPNGHLLAAWIALEDIHEQAGRFYVLPKSHLADLDPHGRLDYNGYMDAVARHFADHQPEVYAPALQKGDVLFWNSRVTHGSLPTQDPTFSRKSLTAHYLPAPYEFGTRKAPFPVRVQYQDWKGMKLRVVPPIHNRYSLSAKVQTDVFAYLHGHRRLRRLAVWAAAMAKR